MAWRIGRKKKKDMPTGIWSKCSECGSTIYNKELVASSMVCPNCGFHHTVGGRQRIEMTVDPGSFIEHFTDLRPEDRLNFVDKVSYAEKLEKAQAKTGNSDACIAGVAKIQEHEVVLSILDFAFMGGSMGEVVGEKIARAIELAEEKKCPVIIFSASGGARMHEGAISLMQLAKTCAALNRFKEKGGFSISVMTNPTTGGVTASFASACDILIGEPGALIGFAGPRVIQNTIRQELPEGFQRAEFLLEKGQLDLIVPREEMREKLSTLLDYSAHGNRVRA
ncbi:MAG: acetyl-CoA carboxylase, carboxyltransferase subunit beta [Planctomycetota bacterium]|jgi:acetyl-CoA carboxylase carboxyl transferase subunit beta|nr:acetyl-CoA carboxylase, carboxyltransferase subunit beta [Planctomycetota bacterium]